MAKLPQPSGHHRRTHSLFVDEHKSRALDGHPLIGRLDELATRGVHEPRYGAGRNLLGRTHIEQISRARGVREPLICLASGHERHSARLRQRACPGAEFGDIRRAPVGVAPPGTMLQAEPGEEPALGAVLQRIDWIGDAEIDERLRADDGACPPCAIDDDFRVGTGDQVADTKHKLAVGAADAAWDGHFAVFGERPPVDDDDVLPGVAHGLEGLRRHARGVPVMLHQLAECLAGDIDAGIERVAGTTPGLRAARQDEDIAVAQRLGPSGRARGSRAGSAGAVVIEHEPHGGVGCQSREAEFKAAVRQRHGEKQVAFAVLAMLAHVEQRDLAAVGEPSLERQGIDRGSHPCHSPS